VAALPGRRLAYFLPKSLQEYNIKSGRSRTGASA
jgi:hypothetical protein